MTAVLICAFGIGFVAGLRAMTAPAAVSWAAHLKWLHLDSGAFAFFGYMATTAFLTLAAIGEIINDKLPKTGSRTAPGPFTVRVIFGAVCGAALGYAAPGQAIPGAVAGAVGAVAGTLGGYHARKNIVAALKVPDYVIALTEDLIAVGGAFLIVSRFQ